MRILNPETTESIVVFATGGGAATIVSFQMFEGVVFPILLAALTGLIGGGAALLGKDLYKHVKKKIFK